MDLNFSSILFLLGGFLLYCSEDIDLGVNRGLIGSCRGLPFLRSPGNYLIMFCKASSEIIGWDFMLLGLWSY
jgi:hypothetical protein